MCPFICLQCVLCSRSAAVCRSCWRVCLSVCLSVCPRVMSYSLFAVSHAVGGPRFQWGCISCEYFCGRTELGSCWLIKLSVSCHERVTWLLTSHTARSDVIRRSNTPQLVTSQTSASTITQTAPSNPTSSAQWRRVNVVLTTSIRRTFDAHSTA